MVAKSRWKFGIMLVAGLAVAGLACSVGGGGGGDGGGGGEPGILFEDDFSDSDSGWDQRDDETCITDYADGAYRIMVNPSQYDCWANPSRDFTDVIVEVEATKAGGPDDNDFGLVCRYQDSSNFYFFLISSDGFYGIGKVEDGSQSLIDMEQMETTDAVRQGDATNSIQAECKGDQLTLTVNGDEVASVSDSTFSSGDVGLIAGTFDDGGTDILFDDFVVREA